MGDESISSSPILIKSPIFCSNSGKDWCNILQGLHHSVAEKIAKAAATEPYKLPKNKTPNYNTPVSKKSSSPFKFFTTKKNKSNNKSNKFFTASDLIN